MAMGLSKALRTSGVARAGLNAYYALTGKGGDWLLHKREYHRRRGEMEREFLRSSGAEVPSKLLRKRACPACGGDAVSSSFENPVGFRFDVCANDGLVYMNPCPTEDALAQLYNDPAESFKWIGQKVESSKRTKPSNREDYEAVLRLVPQHLRGGKLLDVGCSTGGFLLTARESFDVEGVELNDTTAGVARSSGLAVVTGRVADVPGEGRLAVITMLQHIEHLVDVAEQIKEAERLLQKGGALYLNTPAVDSASFKRFRERHMHCSSFGHVSLFSRDALKKLAERSGFEMVAHEYCGGLDVTLADLAGHALNKEQFRHRMAFYSPRLYYGFQVLEETPLREAKRLLLEDARESYQRAVLIKRG